MRKSQVPRSTTAGCASSRNTVHAMTPENASTRACNTMAGAGKDVQSAGEKVEDKAEDCKDGKC